MFCEDCAGRRFQKAQILRRLRKCRLAVPDARDALTLIIRLIRSQAIVCRGYVRTLNEDEKSFWKSVENAVDEDGTVH